MARTSSSLSGARPARPRPTDRGERGVLLLGEERVEYPIRRSRRRSVGLTIDPVAGLIVTAPHQASQQEIHDVVLWKAAWIARHLARFRSGQRQDAGYHAGLAIPFMGSLLQLQWGTAPGQLELAFFQPPEPAIWRAGSVLMIRDGAELTPVDRRDLVESWLIGEARRQLPERVRHYAARLGRQVADIRITAPERQWGACSPRGRITLNWRLILGEVAWADYVAAHEACHLVYRHHQRPFWELVRTLVPDYARLRRELREASPQLVLPPVGEYDVRPPAP